jgi:hypothetical protein
VPDSIQEYRRAASERFRDAVALALRGRRTGAVYLWGYVAEMTLKAAFFEVIGFPSNLRISAADLKGAKAKAKSLGVLWAGNYHDLSAWAQALVSTRATTPGKAYPQAGFANRILGEVRSLHLLWGETLRYHKNIAYLHEVWRARLAAEWLLANATSL